MWSTRAKRALRLGAAGRALAPAASAVPKSGSGRSSAVTRSMSAGAFPPTSSRSTKPRTSPHVLQFAGFSGSRVHRLCGQGIVPRWAALGRATPKQRCLRGSAPNFCDSGGAGLIAPLARRGGLTIRGPTVRLLFRKTRGALIFPEGPGEYGVWEISGDKRFRGDSEAGRLAAGGGRETGPDVPPDGTGRRPGRPGAGPTTRRTAVRLRRTQASPGNMGLIYQVV